MKVVILQGAALFAAGKHILFIQLCAKKCLKSIRFGVYEFRFNINIVLFLKSKFL